MRYNPYVLNALAQLIELAVSPGTSKLIDQSAQLLLLVNSERAKLGIQALKINSALSKLAAVKAQDMVEKDYFNHISPTYGSSFEMLRSHGINYSIAGENLAKDKCADNAHTAWMNSKAHRENILNPGFREIGIGVYAKGSNSFVYTQLFIG